MDFGPVASPIRSDQIRLGTVIPATERHTTSCFFELGGRFFLTIRKKGVVEIKKNHG